MDFDRDRASLKPAYDGARRIDRLAMLAARSYPEHLSRAARADLRSEDLAQYDSLLGDLRLTLKCEMEKHRAAAAREAEMFEEALWIRIIGTVALCKLWLAGRVRLDGPREWLFASARAQLAPILDRGLA